MKLLVNKNHDLVGIAYGIAAPVVMYALLMLLDEYGLTLSQSFKEILCIGSNLPVFYYYINRNMYKSVRGVVIMTIIFALIYIIRFKF